MFLTELGSARTYAAYGAGVRTAMIVVGLLVQLWALRIHQRYQMRVKTLIVMARWF